MRSTASSSGLPTFLCFRFSWFRTAHSFGWAAVSGKEPAGSLATRSRSGRCSRSELLTYPGLGGWELPARTGQASGAGCIIRRIAPGAGGWSLGSFRRSKNFELFGRQLGAQRGDCVLQLARRSSTFGEIVGQPFLEGERIGDIAVAFSIRPLQPRARRSPEPPQDHDQAAAAPALPAARWYSRAMRQSVRP